jgi:uroporphyrin-III C-methyltransferase
MNLPDITQVYLVGAGPGDPDLLTIKAAKAIAKADVILVDDLVNPVIVKQHSQPHARITWVGKRGGCRSTPQAFIERLMIREAKNGNIVVRLKGGDPMVFGRAGEEIGALQSANIRFEVISGITSAIAASARVQASLTHRDHSHGVLFATAHPRAELRRKPFDCSNNKPHATTTDGNELDWATLLNCGVSVVLYMGTQRADWIRQQALDAGLSPHLPVCIVQHASGTNERSVLTTVGEFPDAMRAQHIASPAVLMIGKAFECATTVHNVVHESKHTEPTTVLKNA